MADNTKIEWADSTANLWIGCTKVSPGCDHCYAERDWDNRHGRVTWGPHGDRSYCAAGWAVIRRMQARAARNGGVDPDLGRKRRIFVNSLSDFFDNHRSIVWRGDAFALFEASPDVIIILVTKRPENVAKMVPAHWMAGQWPENVWLLVSAEDQPRADHRIPILLQLPAKVRGVSCEPLLGPVDLSALPVHGTLFECDAFYGIASCGGFSVACPKINWVIVGGESGPGARPMHLDWARSLRDQCTQAGVPFFFKQWGEWAYVGDLPCGGEPFERVGKKGAGRLLNGVEHNGVPA